MLPKGSRYLLASQFLATSAKVALSVGFVTASGVLQSGFSLVLAAVWCSLAFLLPSLAISAVAGVIATRAAKQRVLRVVRGLELVLVSIGCLLLPFALETPGSASSWALLILWALSTGTLFALAHPAGLGIVPELLAERETPLGFGLAQAASVAGALVGLELAYLGLVSNWLLLLVPLFSLGAVAVSWLLKDVDSVDPSAPLRPAVNPINAWKHGLATAISTGTTWPAIIARALFSGVALFMTLNFFGAGSALTGSFSAPLFLAVPLLIAVGLGVLFGGSLLRGLPDIGLVPFVAGLWCLLTLVTAAITLVVTPWMSVTIAMLMLTGFAAGATFPALSAFPSVMAPAEQRGTLLAVADVLSLGAMAVACVLSLLTAAIGLPTWLHLLISAVALAGLVYFVFKQYTRYFCRCGSNLITLALVRLRIVGADHIPQTGPAVVVFNHVSYGDGSIACASIPRFVRFLVDKKLHDLTFLNWMGRMTKAIPIRGDASKSEIGAALRLATEALNEGEIVGIFPEGGISRIGIMQPFQRGLELIMRRAPKDTVIIPGYMHGMWGTALSFEGGGYLKGPLFGRHVTVVFGHSMPADSKLATIRERVQLLSVEAFDHSKEDRHPPHHEFLRQMRRRPFRKAMADSLTPMMSNGQALMRAVILNRLLKRVLYPQQHVGMLLPPSVGGALSNIAIAMMGRVPVNLNYSIGEEVINSCIRQCGIKQVITSKKFLAKVKLNPDAEIVYLEDVRGHLARRDKVFGLLARILPTWATEKFILQSPKISMDDVATIIFSSGSTGDPKGVVLTNHNVTSNVEQIRQVLDTTKRDVMMGVLPFFHSFGYTASLWLPISIGIPAVYHYSPLEPDVIGKLIKKYRATIFPSTATFLRGHMRKSSPDEFETMRLIICGAEKLPRKVAEQFEAKFGVAPVEGYGCTELSPVVSCNRPNEPTDDHLQIGHKPGTIGHPLPGQAVRVVDPDTFQPLPTGEEGLLLIKGPNVMHGYLGKPEMTAEAIRNNWYVTGDIARLDDAGFITITDRMSRFSKIGGEMVPHGKVEDLIHEILETHDRLCVVVGVPDEKKGERLLVLHTKWEKPIEEVWQRLRESDVPSLWVPARTAFHEIEELPVLGSGKLNLKQVKQIALGLAAA
ncbi:Bifunctional protein Aas [Planctomycetes bacterium Pan216]|uniref:Bifunctional protein Aas n=1 Tax=Kolteria novifilia TaxID=2527975 RepID=A0A518B212_9BACT|nr:Bifunctional protein Aas [Planctomycetes bacterium Pan216]